MLFDLEYTYTFELCCNLTSVVNLSMLNTSFLKCPLNVGQDIGIACVAVVLMSVLGVMVEFSFLNFIRFISLPARQTCPEEESLQPPVRERRDWWGTPPTKRSSWRRSGRSFG